MGIGSAIGGIVGAASASSAAKSQERAARDQMAVQKQMYDQTREDLSPYREAGVGSLGAVNYLLGLGSAPMIGGTTPTIETVRIPGTTTGGQTTPRTPGFGGSDYNDSGSPRATTTPATTQYNVGGNSFGTLAEAQAWAKANPTGGTAYSWEGSPGYQWQFDQGQQAIDNSAASSGGLFSGATLKAQQKYGTGLANQDYYNNLNALMGVTNLGQNAAAQSGQAAQNYATGTSNALANIGNAQAAGAIGVGNAISGGINNYLGYQAMQKGTGTQNAGIFSTPWAAGGFW